MSVQYLHARDDELTDVNSPQHYDTPAFVSGWPQFTRSAMALFSPQLTLGMLGFTELTSTQGLKLMVVLKDQTFGEFVLLRINLSSGIFPTSVVMNPL